jgi:hypothetical protein
MHLRPVSSTSNGKTYRTGLALTTSACIDILKTCHLNQRRSEGEPLYDITEIDADYEFLRGCMTPRSSPFTERKRGRRPRRRRS